MCAQYPLLAFLHYLLQTCLHHLFQLFVSISISRQLGTTCYRHSVTTCSWCIYTTLSWRVYTICSRRVHFTRFPTSATPGLSVLRAPSVSSPPSPALSNYPLCLKSMRSKKATSLLKGKKTKPFLFKVSITIPSPHQITRWCELYDNRMCALWDLVSLLQMSLSDSVYIQWFSGTVISWCGTTEFPRLLPTCWF